ncbi:hypothetical protein GJ496_011943 [Pomphorhynchus laevis]|nr:hypothetical protein GJ496_011943 [Pomphorhynchus laevis]
MTKIAEGAAKALIKNTVDQQQVQLQSLWTEKPCVVTFFRRLGCVFCRTGARELSDIKPLLDAANYKLVF